MRIISAHLLRVLGLGVCLSVASSSRGQVTTDSAKYPDLIKRSIIRDYPGMLHQPVGVLAHPFVTPGSVYANELWDWDSWLSDIALCQILTDQGTDKEKTVSYGEGCVLNFLDAAMADGYMPIMIKTRAAQPKPPDDPNKTNMHKPVLAQHAAFLTKLAGGDAAWLKDKFPVLNAFVKNYHDNRRHAATGLYFWADDLAIGVDNDPSTFFRPPGSSGSIFLNCLMYKELQGMAYLSRQLNLEKAVGDDYEKQAEELKAAIQKNCWDERDGFYYSVDLNLRPITNEPGYHLGSNFVLHKGHPRDYDCLIQRIEGWSGLYGHVERHRHAGAGQAHGRGTSQKSQNARRSLRRQNAFEDGKNVWHLSQQQPIGLGRADLGHFKLHRLQRACEIRIYRRRSRYAT